MITKTELIKVSTLKKSHAQQIQWVDRPDRDQMVKDIHPETGDTTKAEVLGKMHGKTLQELGQVNAWTLGWCLLVKTRNGLFWINAPEYGEIRDYYVKHSQQLFV